MRKPKQYRSRKTSSGPTFNGRKKRDSLYDTTWTMYRILFLRINGKCYACGEKATVVDHLVAHKGDDKLFRKMDNHIPLCKMDHDTITAKFDRHEPPDYKGKLVYLAERRAKTGTEVVVKVLAKYGKE